MNDGVKDYVKLHIKIERSLPKLPKDATPEEIDKNQGALQKKARGPGGREARRYLHVPGASGHQTPTRHSVVGSGGQLRAGNIDRGTGLSAKGFDTDLAFMAAEIIGDEMYFQRHFAPGADRRLGHAQAPQDRALIPRDQPNVPCGAEGGQQSARALISWAAISQTARGESFGASLRGW